ncbi:LOW QUALITY PROTEIN: transient receptor potential cation channel subfamily M member 3-like [Haliotis rubra]|uniref:LOW QUALITY PROTEIN: transient receptor potential cation channel subfamily M member 3-like n=1 Tax=Haliotis rubra TaxID=36100 RepID=UPI001EE5ADF8|nr:LOW QUALITY PROTEIN: transient receptor potential cation channel subfamily M member 3-like [Haliotis rubra]
MSDIPPEPLAPYVTLEDARYSDIRKRIGLPRLPTRTSTLQDGYEQVLEEQTDFIRRHFHMKECKKFVPKPDQKVKIVKDLKCHCGEILYNHAGLRKTTRPKNMVTNDLEFAHSFLVPAEYVDMVKNERAKPPEEMPKVSWSADQAIQTFTTNAFGKISFDIEQIGGMKPAKYIRVASTDSEIHVMEMMLKYWRILEPVPPKLVISVIGGAKNFKLDGRMRDTFNSGLIKAAKTTSAWLITSGFNMGVMKAVGQAVHEGQTFQWDNDRMTHVLRCIGIAPWGYVKGRHFLESSDGRGKFNANYRTSNTILHGQPVHLNADHTHFIFVDDGMRNRYGGVADFRAKFEENIMSSRGIPVVLVVVEGGQDALMDAATSLKQGIPVVVCAGTGRAADILAYAFTHTVKSPSGERYMREKHLRVLEHKLFKAFGKSWGKKAETESVKYMEIVMECCQYEERIIIFPINKHEDLDLAILSVLLKAGGGVKAGDNKLDRLNQLKLALTWNRADIAQEEIFREDVNWNQEHLIEAMTMALEEDKVDFVKLILNQGIIMREYLTVQKLESLYNKIPKHGYLRPLLTRFSKKPDFNLSDIGAFLTKLLDKYDDEKFQEAEGQNVPVISQSSSLRKPKMTFESTDTDDTEEKDQFKRPFKQLLIWAILMNRVDLAMFFWEMGEEPISSAIAITRICQGMFKKIPKYQTKVREDFLKMKVKFERLAMWVLDECHLVDPSKAMMLVERKSLIWSKMSCLQMAASANDQAFLSSVACQDSINTTWKHGILSNWKYVFYGILFPPFIFFVEVAKMGETRFTVAQKLLTFYTAPMTKFGCYTLSYLAFLGLFSFLVLVDFKATPSIVEWICILWTLSFLTGETHAFLMFPIPTFKGKLRDWFSLLDKMDICNLLLVFIGFSIRWNHDLFFSAKMIYCFNVIIFYLRILKMYTAHSQLGPKLFMIMRMLEELVLFVMILVVFLLAYGVASQGLLYPQRKGDAVILKDIVFYPYWQLYGEIFLDEIETDQTCMAALQNVTTVTPFNNTCRTSNWMVPILLGIYLSVGNILLLNLLIAIFSHVFDTVEENSIEIWKFQMYYLVMEYDIKTSIIPPFNIVKHAYYLMKWIFRKTCCKKTTETQQYLQRHLTYLQLFEKEMMANHLRHEKASQSNTLETKVKNLQKRVDELTKLIEDELIAEQHGFGIDATTLGQTQTLPLPVKEQEQEKKVSRWPSVKRVLKLRDEEQRLQDGLNIDNLFAEAPEDLYNKNKLEGEMSRNKDVVMDEVKKKHKKKKAKKDPKRESKKEKKKRKKDRFEEDEDKELNINLADYEPKPEYLYKHMNSDSSPTRGHPLPQMPRGLIPLSPRQSFLKSRSEALPWSESEEDLYEKQTSRNLNPLNIQTKEIPRELQSPDFSDDENVSKSAHSSRLLVNRRARRQERKRISDLEERLMELERSSASQDHSYVRNKYR